jgi:hypothetical protein
MTLDSRPDIKAYPEQANGKRKEDEKESNQYFHVIATWFPAVGQRNERVVS